MRFLVVEEPATMRRLVGSLERIGLQQCVEAGDGLDFVRALSSRDESGNVPALRVTTRPVREDIVQAAQAGVNDHVVEPFTPQVPKEKIDRVFGALQGAG